MHIDPADNQIVKWAIDRGLVFSYERNSGLGGTHLKLHIGLLTAHFRRGKLAHLSAAASGHRIDELMRELTELFGLCAQSNSYLDQVGLQASAASSVGSSQDDGRTDGHGFLRRMTG
ncbi:MAG: hypothetical protein JXQ73_29180 [Phycisphaerae bacterium]|nr:hypothetical protein [Phycisphaerae bacterium]